MTLCGEGCVRYHDVRAQIRTGDLLLFRGSHPLSRLIRRATHSPYSHAGLLTWWAPREAAAIQRLMVLEATHPFITLRPASEVVGAYLGTVDWFPLQEQYRPKLRTEVLLQEALERLGNEYSVAGLFDNLWARLGLLALAARSRGRKRFCSEYVSECMRMALQDPVVEVSDHFTSPQALSQSPLWRAAGRLQLPRVEHAQRRDETRQAQLARLHARGQFTSE